MMKKNCSLVLSLLLLAPLTLVAQTKRFDLKINLALDGETPTQYQLVLKEGIPGHIVKTVTHDKFEEKNYIDVIAKDGTMPNSVDLHFFIGKIDENGKKLKAKEPQIMAMTEEEAKVEWVLDSGKKELELSVIAKKI